MFKDVNSKIDFPSMEKAILNWWDNQGIMKTYLQRNKDASKRFSFIDGPITANNPMGVHHAWGRTYKDLFQRYKTMKGFKQRYQNGFDCQGLWVEVEVEKELGLKSKQDIESFGIEKFVEMCKARVRKYADIQTQQSINLGYWMDWDNSYFTMSDENNYTIWHFLKICHEKGWIYEGTDVMEWCPRCGTGLSQQEVVTEGYRDIVHPGLFVKFPLIDSEGEALLVWTTTPWTLTSNTGVYVHPDLTYVRIRTEENDVLYLLKSRLVEIKKDYQILEEMSGDKLDGLIYQGPFDELPAQAGVEHRVVLWEEVNENEGTGIVHTAPGAGAEDFRISKERDLQVIAPLDEFGIFIEGFDWLTGKSVFDVNDSIYKDLKSKGFFYRLEKYKHRYPVCWRCDTELVFRLVDEWFISMDVLREKIANIARNIRWIPEFGLDRELDWLRNMDDWMISKKRYWGLALPIYKCKCGETQVIGSEIELEELAVEGWNEFNGNSPHRPWIDSVKISCSQCGDPVSRIKDVGNVWLDAGIVPYSTIGYRNDKEYWKEWFPAEWISESFPGQFRGWFYSLLVMSTVLEETEPFKNLYSYATMRDEHGEEMHKSKGNAIWFEDGAEKMGVDAMRWLYCRQNPAANLNFGYRAADEVRRQFLIPLWNVYSFFVTYANIDGYDPTAKAPDIKERPELDRWILSELQILIVKVSTFLDDYQPDKATRLLEEFVNDLSNWYVRRSRRRFWRSDTDTDKLSAYETLYECLVTIIKLLAPMTPFITEKIYQNLVGKLGNGKGSVHLEDFPEAKEKYVDEDLSEATRLAMKLCSLGRSARSQAGIKVRQPLNEMLVKLRFPAEEKHLNRVLHQIIEELNIKNISVLDNENTVARYNIKPDMSKIGPKYGSRTKEILNELSKADHSFIANLILSNKPVNLGDFTIEPGELVAESSAIEGYIVSTEAGYTVAISTIIGDELRSEGFAREFIHLVQTMRRSADFMISDRIIIYFEGHSDIDSILENHNEYIKNESLADEISRAKIPSSAYVEKHEIDDNPITIAVCLSSQPD